MKIDYKRIDLSQRITIEKLLALGKNQTQIADALSVNKSTISNELKLCKKDHYVALRAHKLSVSNISNRKFGKVKIDATTALGKLVLCKLKLHWSPEQIHLFLKKNYPLDKSMQISMESIYFYIYVHVKPALKKELIGQLRQKRAYRGNVRRGVDKRTTIKDPIRIDERPNEVIGREIPGHWEGDLIIGKNHDSAIGTLNERSSRTVILVHLKAKDATSVRKAFEREFKTIPAQMKKSLTYDNGSEMAEHKRFTKNTNVTVYFAHPYSPWERPTNENSNGLIRDYFPKGTDFNTVTKKELKKVQNQLNERPRKILDMCTPKEVFAQYVLSGL